MDTNIPRCARGARGDGRAVYAEGLCYGCYQVRVPINPAPAEEADRLTTCSDCGTALLGDLRRALGEG